MEQISKDLEQNIAVIEKAFQNCGDIVKRRFFVGEKKDVQIYMVYTDNIVNGSAIEESILTNVMNRCRIDGKKEGLFPIIIRGGGGGIGGSFIPGGGSRGGGG